MAARSCSVPVVSWRAAFFLAGTAFLAVGAFLAAALFLAAVLFLAVGAFLAAVLFLAAAVFLAGVLFLAAALFLTAVFFFFFAGASLAAALLVVGFFFAVLRLAGGRGSSSLVGAITGSRASSDRTRGHESNAPQYVAQVLVEIGVVGDHEVRARTLRLERQLRGLATRQLSRVGAPGGGLGVTLCRGGVHEQQVVAVAIEARLQEKRHVEDEEPRPLGRAVSSDSLLDGRQDRRVDERLEASPGRRVLEHAVGQPRPIGNAGLAHRLGTERVHQPPVGGRRGESRVRQRVGIHHLGAAQAREAGGYRRLAGTHAS